jgi:hypothetical protein
MIQINMNDNSKTINNDVVVKLNQLPKEIRDNMTDEQKKEHKRLYRNYYYRNYYNNNKEMYKKSVKQYTEKNKDKLKKKLKDKYDNDAEFRAKKSIEFYKKKYHDNEYIQNTIKDNSFNCVEKINKIQTYRTNIKFSC